MDSGASNVLEEVFAERDRQDAKWGQQNHPDGTGDWFAANARVHRQLCDRATEQGRVAWADILLEEVYEALAEENPAALRAELIQVAAVATAWVEAIDRRTGRVGTLFGIDRAAYSLTDPKPPAADE